MKQKTLVTVLALLLIVGAGAFIARSADAETPTAAPVPGTIIPAPLQLAAGSIDGGVTALSGCSAENDCADGSSVSCTGNSLCYVIEGGVRCDNNYTYCSCYHPECSNPGCECDCYDTYGYGSGLVRCLTNCSIGC